MDAGILCPKKGKANTFDLAGEEKAYRRRNLLGHTVGIAVGFIIALWNYSNVIYGSDKCWAAPGGKACLLTWVFVVWQMGVMWSIVGFYIYRYFATIRLFGRILESYDVHIDVFNLDNAAGLRPLGSIGLRNQCLLIAFGINLGFLAWVCGSIAFSSVSYFIVTAIVAYVLLGPLVFIGPLVPFRNRMKAAKVEKQGDVALRLKKKHDKLMEIMRVRDPTKEEWEGLEELQHFKKTVDRIPVWPFDSATLKRFFLVYAIPAVAFVASEVVRLLISKILQAQS